MYLWYSQKTVIMWLQHTSHRVPLCFRTHTSHVKSLFSTIIFKNILNSKYSPLPYPSPSIPVSFVNEETILYINHFQINSSIQNISPNSCLPSKMRSLKIFSTIFFPNPNSKYTPISCLPLCKCEQMFKT